MSHAWYAPRLMSYTLHVICNLHYSCRLHAMAAPTSTCTFPNIHMWYAHTCMHACTHTWQQLLISPLTHLRYALGLNPSSLALSSLISKQAEAPSVCNSREGGRGMGGEREREEIASNLECCIRCVFCILAKHLALQNYTTTRTILDRTLVHTSPRQQYNELTPWLTKKEALAAVIVPWGLTNAGFSFAICSGVDTRMPLSALTAVPFPVLVPCND